jgi:hypothetical protein
MLQMLKTVLTGLDLNLESDEVTLAHVACHGYKQLLWKILKIKGFWQLFTAQTPDSNWNMFYGIL